MGLLEESLVWYPVERLAKVEYNHVCLGPLVKRFCQLMGEGEKLSFAAPPCSETMLAVM